jgi:hypothetical protein
VSASHLTGRTHERVVDTRSPSKERSRDADDHSKSDAGVKPPGNDGHHDKSESARPASDTGEGRCEALEWLAANLRWNRTLDLLRASARANDR